MCHSLTWQRPDGGHHQPVLKLILSMYLSKMPNVFVEIKNVYVHNAKCICPAPNWSTTNQCTAVLKLMQVLFFSWKHLEIETLILIHPNWSGVMLNRLLTKKKQMKNKYWVKVTILQPSFCRLSFPAFHLSKIYYKTCCECKRCKTFDKLFMLITGPFWTQL